MTNTFKTATKSQERHRAFTTNTLRKIHFNFRLNVFCNSLLSRIADGRQFHNPLVEPIRSLTQND